MAIFTAADGCPVYYEQFGDRGPRIVLIPGLGGDGRFWNGVVKLLETDYRLTVVDHRGSGRSGRPQGDYSLKQIAADIAAIIKIQFPKSVKRFSDKNCGKNKRLEQERDSEIAHSALDAADLGGAAEIGLSYLISSSWAQSDARFRAIFTARAQMLEAGLLQAYQHLSHVFCYDAAYLASHEQELALHVEQAAENLAPLSVATARVWMLLAHDRLDDLAKISAPVRIVAAQDDLLIPPSLSSQIADAIAGAKFITVKGAHFHPQTHPLEFAALIRQFVQEIVSTGMAS